MCPSNRQPYDTYSALNRRILGPSIVIRARLSTWSRPDRVGKRTFNASEWGRLDGPKDASFKMQCRRYVTCTSERLVELIGL
jgi:hypothetical protein